MKKSLAIQQAEATIARAQARLEQLMNLPDEPTTVDEDGALTVWFQRRAEVGVARRPYTYAAVRVPSTGMWYVTGGYTPLQGVSWEELVEWIMADKEAVIWKATRYEVVA